MPRDDGLLELYRRMLRIRLVEERIAERYARQEMRCPVHLCVGQEAVSVGVCASLSRDDYAMSGHRSHGPYLAKGGDLRAMLAELFGKMTGCTGGKGGSMHLVDLAAGFLGAIPIVAAAIPIAVGTAFGSVMQRRPRVTATFFGEAAAEEGVFHESLNFAALKRLPIVFICENNLYSVYSPLSVRQPAPRQVFELAQGHGLESHQGDGNDVLEVRALAEAAISKARRGDRPTFLEFRTYRWREHCGPLYDNTLGYRPVEEFEAWKQRCPVARLERRLLEEGLASAPGLQEMQRALQAEIDEAMAFACESRFPEPSQMMEHVYAP